MLRNSGFFVLSFVAVVSAQFAPSALGGSVGCVVTKNKLFSSGNYIRDLKEPELKILIQYKKDLVAFKKKIQDAFDNVDNLDNNKTSTLPPMPVRPIMPQFCTGSDTTMYILSGCSVQNYKVYIGKTFARNLDQKERIRLDRFVKQMQDNEAASKSPSATTVSTANLQKDLDFCTEM